MNIIIIITITKNIYLYFFIQHNTFNIKTTRIFILTITVLEYFKFCKKMYRYNYLK